MKSWVVVVAIGVVIAIAYGGGVGSANQVTYLVEPLRRAHVDLFARDWLAMDTTHYHGAFVALTTELFRADDTGAIAFGIAHLVTIVAAIGALLAILTAIAASRRLALLLLVVGWIVLGGSRALGGSYLVATYFQPSSIATVAWLVAIAYWLRERHVAAGVALAVGGAFHVNFLVLGIGYFAAIEMFAWRIPRARRVLALVAPSLAVLAALAPSIVAAGDAREPALALRILVEFHAPSHYDARVAIAQLPPLVGWLLAAWACSPSREPALALLWRVALVGTAACTLIFLAILVEPAATRLFVWRIAPFAQLASQLVAIVAVFSTRTLFDRHRSLGIPIGVGVVVGWSIPQAQGLYTIALACTILGAVAYRRSHAGRKRVVWVAGIVVCMLALVPARHRLVAPDLFTEALGGRYRDLILWARTTDRDALFVVPPYVHAFRLLARRAIVADSRSPPLYPDELVAWYRRLCALVDVDDAATHQEIEQRYDQLSAAAMIAAARRFDAQYVVIDKQRSATRLLGPPVFEDWRVVVYGVAAR